MIVKETAIPGFEVKRGKVRDVYDLGDKLLLVTTDRLSAFDVVLPDPIPEKGKILHQLSMFWFNETANLIRNHVMVLPHYFRLPEFRPYKEALQGRSMLVWKAEPLKIECIVRGYISGSGWKNYQETGKICGIKLPKGLRESDILPEPIFTPSTKAEGGEHDENIDLKTAGKIVGPKIAEYVRNLSLRLYRMGAGYALNKGIIIADTKFEFGLHDDELILIDEVLTPDSSRFWPASKYKPGRPQESFDKQFVRDYLREIGWNKKPPGPPLPLEVIEGTTRRYLEAFERLVPPDYSSY